MKKCCQIIIAVLACAILSGCASIFPKSQTSPSAKDVANNGKVSIKWQNETEQDNYGFNIYRGENKEGPFVKINKDIIPGAGTTSTPREYVYVDQPLEIGKIYFYYVESVSFAGIKETITPTVKVVVKNIIEESENMPSSTAKKKSKGKK